MVVYHMPMVVYHMHKSVGQAVAMVTCVSVAASFGGCGGVTGHASGGGGAKRTTSAPSTAKVSPEVAVCMRRNGVTVLADGGLRVPKGVTDAKRKAAEDECGFAVTRPVRHARYETNGASAAAKSPRARGFQSFHSRLVARIAACLHSAGVKIPSLDSALLSSTSGIKSRSPRIKAVISRCRNGL